MKGLILDLIRNGCLTNRVKRNSEEFFRGKSIFYPEPNVLYQALCA